MSGLYDRVFGNPGIVKIVRHFGTAAEAQQLKLEGTRDAIDALHANLKCHAAEAPEGYEVEFAEPTETSVDHPGAAGRRQVQG